MNSKTELNLMVFNRDVHPPEPPWTPLPPPQPEAPHAHHPMEQLHQRSHQGIPQWIMDEAHGSYQPSYKNLIPSTLFNSHCHGSYQRPWFLSKSHPINPAFNPHGSHQPPWFLSSPHPINPAFEPSWLPSTPMVPIKILSHLPCSPSPHGSYQHPPVPPALACKPSWFLAMTHGPPNTPKFLVWRLPPCSLPHCSCVGTTNRAQQRLAFVHPMVRDPWL